jgi:hypothetical protein
MKTVKPVLDAVTERIAQMLEPNDREAICGDLVECRITGLTALFELIGFVVRRKSDRLLNSRSWILPVLIAIPLGLSLATIAVRTADGTAVYVWLYTENLKASLFEMPAYWRGMAELLPRVLVQFIVLSTLSFGLGLLMRTVSGRALWPGASVFVGMLLVAGSRGVPLGFRFVFALERGRDYFGNSAVFSNAFYRSAYPEVIVLLFAVLPFLFGIRIPYIPARPDLLFVFVSFETLICALLCQSLSWAPLHLWDMWPSRIAYLPSPIEIASIAPAVLLCMAARRSDTTRKSTHYL